MDLMERHKVVHCFPESVIANFEDFFTGSPVSDVIHLDHYRECTFVIIKGAGAVGTAVPTVNSCSDAAGTTAADVAYKYRAITAPNTHGAWTDATSTGFTTAAAADTVYEIRVLASGLSGTNEFVKLTLSEDDSTAVDGAGFAILTDPRYIDSDPDTAGSDVI